MPVSRLHISLKTRLLLIQTGIWLLGISVAGALILKHAHTRVRAESASNLQLVQQLLGPVLADGATLSRRALKDMVKGVSQVRHVRVVTDPNRAGSQAVPVILVSDVPEWFTRLVSPPPQTLLRIALPGSDQSSKLVIEANPADEIREVWEDVRTLLWITGGVFMLVSGLLFCTLAWIATAHATARCL
jgi:two-component system, NarL family, sensor histidine kinase UhpB